jgi:tetratricopeptide (TPR) repeat protein
MVIMESPHNSHKEFEQVRFEPRDVQADAIKAFLVAADALSHSGELTQAELRYKQALRQAELAFGENSDHAKRVLSILTAFYRNHGREEEAREIELRLLLMNPDILPDEPAPCRNLQSRFLRKKITNDQLLQMNRVVLPPDIRKACQVLGMPTSEEFSTEDVLKAWKRRIVAGSVHPDLGGENEHSVLVNTSKDLLIRWLESRLPKLGLGRQIDSFQAK